MHLIFIFKDIKNNKFYFIWNLIQMGIVCILISVILQSIFDYYDVKKKFDTMTVGREIYMFGDDTSEQKMDELLNEKKKLSSLVSLYNFIEKKVSESNGKIIEFTANSGWRFYYDEKLAHDFVDEFNLPKDSSDSLDLLAVSSNFFDIYRLKIEGNISEFSNNSHDTTPVVLGNDFKKLYKLHDTLCDYRGKEYEIVGFLESGAYYIAPGETRSPIYLDRFVLKPAHINKSDSTDLISYFSTTYYITKDVTFMEQTLKRSEEELLLTLHINHFTHQMNAIRADIKDELILNGSLLVLLFAFCIIAMTGNILQFISNTKRVLAIHMMSGASKWTTIFRILIQIWCVNLIMMGIVCVLYRPSKTMLLSLAFLLIYLLLIGIIPIKVLRQQTIRDMLRNSYE